MAITNIDSSAIGAALAVILQPELVRQFNRQAVFLSKIPVKPGKGKSVSWDVRFTRSTHAAAFTEGSDLADAEFQFDATVPATLGWGQYRVGFSVTGLAIAAAMSSNTSPEELVDLVGSNMTDAASDLISTINAHAWTGSGSSGQIAGLITGGALANTGTYANIARTGGSTNYTDWSATVLANGGTARPLTKSLIDQAEATVFSAVGQTPDLIIASPGVVRKYESLFDSVVRTAPMGAVNNARDIAVAAPSATPGSTGLFYKGIPVIRDRNAATGYMIGVNTQYVETRVLQQGRSAAAEVSEQVLGTAGGAPETPVGFSARVEPLAKTGDASKYQLIVYLQLVVRRPQACFVIGDISES